MEKIYSGPGDLILSREPDNRLGVKIESENNAMKISIPVSTLLSHLRELGFIK